MAALAAFFVEKPPLRVCRRFPFRGGRSTWYDHAPCDGDDSRGQAPPSCFPSSPRHPQYRRSDPRTRSPPGGAQASRRVGIASRRADQS